MILFCVFQWFRPSTIGRDDRHMLYVNIIPISIGIIAFSIYFYRMIDAEDVASLKNIWQKITYPVFLICLIFITSFLTFGFIANVVFESINYSVAAETKTKTLILPVDRFYEGYSGRRREHAVYFILNNEEERVLVHYRDLMQYQAEAATKKRIRLSVREGIWNHYIVDGYRIIR